MRQSIELTLERVNDAEALAFLHSVHGDARCRFVLPWGSNKEWNVIFLCLRALQRHKETWPDGVEIIELARELRYVANDGTPLRKRVERIGTSLYRSVFSDRAFEQVFQRALYGYPGEPPIVELHISDAGSYLQTYPWEVLHDGSGFLFDSRRAVLVRYVDFGEPLNPIKLNNRVSVLLVDPRPKIPETGAKLPALDRGALKGLLSEAGDSLEIHELDPVPEQTSTYISVARALNRLSSRLRVIHIDAHGEYGRLCERCGDLSPFWFETCQGCGWAFPKELNAQGYIAFEKSGRNLDWISGQKLGRALANQGVQLVVLSACDSGLIGGGSVFNSVAGALVRRGIPAVVAMQFCVEAESTKAFMGEFYGALLDCAPLTRAMAAAKICLDVDAWYRPVLYLRADSSNKEGRIFEPDAPLIAGEAGSDNPVELLAELVEWKQIHSESQASLDLLNEPLGYLWDYCMESNPKDLAKAGLKWQEFQARKLRPLRDKWNFQYARTPALDDLFAKARPSVLDEITKQLMQTDIQRHEFNVVHSQLADLKGILWALLSVADKKIVALVEELKRRMDL